MKYFLILISLALTSVSHAQTMYIDDTLFAPLRSGEGTGFRIVHKGLRSGTKVEVLNKNSDSGYSKVRTSSGIEGFLPSRFLVAEPIARIKLQNAEVELAAAKKESQDSKTALSALQAKFDELQSTFDNASSSLSKTEKELSNIKAISSNAINLDKRNRELHEANERLRSELEMLKTDNLRLKDKSESNMMLMGGGLVALGVILALIVPLMKTSKKTDSWA